MKSQNALVVELVRDSLVECSHQVHAVICQEGKVIQSYGNPELDIFPRSSIKPIQALPFIESGAFDHFNCSEIELTLACASHSGEEQHISVVKEWLTRMALSEKDLECGSHPPVNSIAAHAAYKQGFSQLHNNCSGKHTAMLATAMYFNETTKNYVSIDHPVQKRVIQTLLKYCGLTLNSKLKYGIDGCSIPTLYLSLSKLAFAAAQFSKEASIKNTSAWRISHSIMNNSFYLAGTDRYCTQITSQSGGQFFVKTGAEGVMALFSPEKNIGIFLKALDGGTRAAELAMSHLILKSGLALSEEKLLYPEILNAVGKSVARLKINKF